MSKLKKDLLIKSYEHFYYDLMPIAFDVRTYPEKRIEQFMRAVKSYLTQSDKNRLFFIEANKLPEIIRNDITLKQYIHLWLHAIKYLIGPDCPGVNLYAQQAVNQLIGATIISEALHDNKFIESTCDYLTMSLLNTYKGKCDMHEFKDLINPNLLNAMEQGDPRAKFEVGLIALRHHRLGFAEILLNEAKAELL